MKTGMLPVLLLALCAAIPAMAEQEPLQPMQGVPPSRDSQVTMANYRDYPMNVWAFRNAGAPLHLSLIHI